MQKIEIAGYDWDMTTWIDTEITVAGVVMALEGSGADEDLVEVIDAYGKPLSILGVRHHSGRVQIVLKQAFANRADGEQAGAGE